MDGIKRRELTAFELEAMRDAETDDYDETSNQSYVVRTSKLTAEQKEIVAHYVGVFEVLALNRDFARIRKNVVNLEAALRERDGVNLNDPDEMLRAELTSCVGLRSNVAGILNSYGFYYFYQFTDWSVADLRDLKNVGAKTVSIVAAYMAKCGRPLATRSATRKSR